MASQRPPQQRESHRCRQPHRQATVPDRHRGNLVVEEQARLLVALAGILD